MPLVTTSKKSDKTFWPQPRACDIMVLTQAQGPASFLTPVAKARTICQPIWLFNRERKTYREKKKVSTEKLPKSDSVSTGQQADTWPSRVRGWGISAIAKARRQQLYLFVYWYFFNFFVHIYKGHFYVYVWNFMCANILVLDSVGHLMCNKWPNWQNW